MENSWGDEGRNLSPLDFEVSEKESCGFWGAERVVGLTWSKRYQNGLRKFWKEFRFHLLNSIGFLKHRLPHQVTFKNNLLKNYTISKRRQTGYTPP